MKVVAILALFLALAVAQNALPSTPYYWIFTQGTNSQLNFGVKNNQTATITNTFFSVLPQDNDVYISYPGGGSKATIGQIYVGSTGYASFYAVGIAGLHYATVSVSYKKGLNTYTFSAVVQFQITDTDGGGSAGKRNVEEEEYWPADEPADAAVTRSMETRGADLTLSPTYFQCADGVTTWVSLALTTGSTAVKNVSFAVAPATSNVYINYPTSGNNLGNIGASTTRGTSFAITGPYGQYSLTLIAQYKKGISNTVYYEYQTATLAIYQPGTSAGKRSDLDLDVKEKAAIASAVNLRNSDGTINVPTAVGLGAGVAFVALVAVGAAVFVAQKRNATPTLAL